MVDLFNISTSRGIQRVGKRQGPQGETGASGSVTTYGTTAPDNSQGENLDIYFQTDDDGVVIKIYQKYDGIGMWLEIGDVNPAWISFTPVIGWTHVPTLNSIVAKYKLINGTVFYNIKYISTDAGATLGVDTSFSLSLPFDPATNTNASFGVSLLSGAGNVGGHGYLFSFGGTLLFVRKYDGVGAVMAGSPLTAIISGFYEVAT